MHDPRELNRKDEDYAISQASIIHHPRSEGYCSKKKPIIHDIIYGRSGVIDVAVGFEQFQGVTCKYDLHTERHESYRIVNISQSYIRDIIYTNIELQPFLGVSNLSW